MYVHWKEKKVFTDPGPEVIFTIHNPIKKSKSGKGSSPEYSIISTLQKTHRTYLYSLYMLGTI